MTAATVAINIQTTLQIYSCNLLSKDYKWLADRKPEWTLQLAGIRVLCVMPKPVIVSYCAARQEKEEIS